MSTLLHIETSTDICSVALSKDGACLFERTDSEGRNHAVKAGTFVDEALSYADSQLLDLDAVAVSSGPGSYTGLRVGVSMAKGVCYGRGISLISVPTLELLAVPVLLSNRLKVTDGPATGGQQPATTLLSALPDNALLCPMVDARRMEVYAQLFDRSLKPVREIQADVVTAETYRPWLDRQPVYFFGNGAAKCMETIAHPNAHLIEGIEPLARWMFPLAEKRFFQQQFEDVAYFVPFYLKDFVAKQPRKLL